MTLLKLQERVNLLCDHIVRMWKLSIERMLDSCERESDLSHSSIYTKPCMD